MVRCWRAVVCCDAVGGRVSVFVVALLVEAGVASRCFGAGGGGGGCFCFTVVIRAYCGKGI